MRLNEFTIGQRVYAPNTPLGGFAANVTSINTSEGYLTLDHNHANGQPWRCYEINGHVRSRGRDIASRTLSRFYVYWGENAQTQTLDITPQECVAQATSPDEFKDFTTGVEIELFARRASWLQNKLVDDFSELNVGGDGSIHGYPSTHSSLEIKTHVLKKDTIASDIKKICERIDEADGDVNSSCGLHVHIGSSQFTNEQLLNVLKTFNAIEPVIYAMQPASRRKTAINTRSYGYCKALCDNKITKYLDKLTMAEELVYQKRLKTTRGVKTRLNKLLSLVGLNANDKDISAKFARNYSILRKIAKPLGFGNAWSIVHKLNELKTKYAQVAKLLLNPQRFTPKELDYAKLIDEQHKLDNKDVIRHFDYYKGSHNKSGVDRYFGCNMTSHFYRGTIEFRYHAGTVNATKILNWIKLLHNVVDYATTRFSNEHIKAIEAEDNIMNKINLMTTSMALPENVKAHCIDRVNNFISSN